MLFKKKYFVTLILFFIFSGCSTSTPVNNKAIANKPIVSEIEYKTIINKLSNANLVDAKYIAGKIWEDRPINARSEIMNYDEASNYCKNLTLLGSNHWTLPSSDDFIELKNELKSTKSLSAFNYSLPYNAHRYYYFTTTGDDCPFWRKGETCVEGCRIAGGNLYKGKTVPLYLTDTPLSITDKDVKGSVRCVLDINEYAKDKTIKLRQSNNIREEGTYLAYINAFKMTKNISDIKKAYSLAKTLQEKQDAEKIMVQTIPKKVFVLYNGKDATSPVKEGGVDIGFTGSAVSEKDFSKIFTLKSDFLQYGSYDVKIKFNLDITYDEQRLTSFYTSQEHKEKILIFHLNPSNNYKQTKTVSFKDVIVGMGLSTVGIKFISKKMKDIKLSYEIIGVK